MTTITKCAWGLLCRNHYTCDKKINYTPSQAESEDYINGKICFDLVECDEFIPWFSDELLEGGNISDQRA